MTTRFTYWLGQQWWGVVFAMLIEVYFTKEGREIARGSKSARKLDGCCGGIHADF